MQEDVVIIIPAYNPDEKFIAFLDELYEYGYKKVIVVNDGSIPEKKVIFDEAFKKYQCDIVEHNINLGQGRAFKSGFNYFLGKYANDDSVIGVVECDCDGQHVLEDVNKCSQLLRENPQSFILGVRDFNNPIVPFRSRFGNKITSLIFKLFVGLNIKDTQTGLKAIPKEYIPIFIETSGERFEYASAVLMDIKRYGIPFIQFSINTIYIQNNKSSHFRPLIDSIRIYTLIFKYTLASISASIVDLVLFAIFVHLIKFDNYILLSTYVAKVVSCTYSYFVNKNLVFIRKSASRKTVVMWIALCIIQATISGVLTSNLVSVLHMKELYVKVVVDIFLFFFSFQFQNRWIFR